MDKPNQMKEKKTHLFNTNKKVILGISTMLIICMLLLMNLNFIQMNYYKVTGNTTSIINILSKEVKKPKAQSKLYFKMGMNYLIKDMSEPSCAFLEKEFLKFEGTTQKEILINYNKNQKFFANQESLFNVAIKREQDESIKAYLKRMSIEQFEFALKDYFGKDMKLSQGTVTKLYTLAGLYPKKLPLDKFQISIYELMSFPHEGNEESMSLKLLSRCEGEAARKILLQELKTKAIEVDLLSTWVEILNKNQMLSTQEYALFTNNYSGILQLREQYKQLEEQKIDLQNIKKQIDVQTEEFENKIKNYTEKIERLNQVGKEKDTQLGALVRYKTIALYIMDYYGEGQYEASIPQKSWFFNTYKPSDEKAIIKLTHTTPKGQGVYTFNAYEEGSSENGLPYYVEVSKEETDRIQQLKEEIEQTINQKDGLENQITLAKQEIDKVRKANNYEQNINLLEELEKNKETIKLKLKEHQVAIQKLFEIGNVLISVK